MAARTTDLEVRSIMDLADYVDTTAFIETAALMVDRVEAAGEADATLLEMIERWLTAHLIVSTVTPQTTLKQIDITEERWFIPKGGDDLESTPYGRQALALDRTGVLCSFYAEKAYTYWIGDSTPND